MWNKIKSACSAAKKQFSRIMPLVFNSRTKGRVIAGTVLIFSTIATNLLGPVVLGRAFGSLQSGEPLELIGVEVPPEYSLVAYGAIYTVSSLLVNFRDLVITPLGAIATKVLALRYIENIMHLSLQYHKKTAFGIHIKRFIEGFTFIPNVTAQVLILILSPAAEISVLTGLMAYWYGPQIGLPLGGVIIVFVGYNLAFKHKAIYTNQQKVIMNEQAFKEISSTMNTYETIHLMSLWDKMWHKMLKVFMKFNRTDNDAVSIVYIVGIGQRVIAGAGFTILYWLVGKAILSQTLTLGDLVFISTWLTQFSAQLPAMGTAIYQLLASLVALDDIFNSLEQASEIPDRPNRPLLVSRHALAVEFSEVEFSYQSSETKASPQPILNNVSFAIEHGEIVWVVGPSGAGKSSLMSLIYRFYDPTQGVIRINGQNIRDVTLADLRKHICVVPQSATLFNASLRANLYPWELLDDEDLSQDEITARDPLILEALDRVAMTDYVQSLEEKLDTVMGERGSMVSGGQSQRIAIARAFMKDHAMTAKVCPSIFLFDEPTSALDTETKKTILESIRAFIKERNCTALIITHDMNAIASNTGDRIIALSGGKVAQMGTREELMRDKSGVFSTLWREQNASFVGEEQKEAPLIKSPKPVTHLENGGFFPIGVRNSTLLSSANSERLEESDKEDQIEVVVVAGEIELPTITLQQL